MTVALVQQTVGQVAATTSTTVTLPGGMGNAGHLLVALVGRSGGLATGALTGVTDSAGNNWSRAIGGAVSGSSNTRIEMWYFIPSTNITTISFNSATSQTFAWNVSEWSGMLSPPYDVASTDNSGVASTTAVATPSITTTVAGDLVIAAIQSAFVTGTLNQAGSSPTSGWTSLTEFDNASTTSGEAAYLVDATTGARSAAWTLATAHAAGVLTVAFKASSVATSNGTIAQSATVSGAATATWVAIGSGTVATTVSVTKTATAQVTMNTSAARTVSMTGSVTGGVPGAPISATVAKTASLTSSATATFSVPTSSGGATPIIVVAGAGTAGFIPAAVAGALPPGRGRWRLTCHNRQFSAVSPNSTILTELPEARNRKLVQTQNSAAILTFDMDGQAASAALVNELQTDVIAWRWSETLGRDVAMFRGIVAQSQDVLDEQSHVVTFTCHDYLDVLKRRYLAYILTFAAVEQDTIVLTLVFRAGVQFQASDSTSFMPASYLPLTVATCNPDASFRGPSGIVRDRTYLGNQEIGQAIDDLANVINGFGYDVQALGNTTTDMLRVFYPQQGITRTLPVLEMGGSVSTIKRTVDSGSYANYSRRLGNNQLSDPLAAQLIGEAYNADASSIVNTQVGSWMVAESSPDVVSGPTLVQQAQGDVNLYGVLVPTYEVGMTPGFYTPDQFQMGDTLPLVINSGRLQVNTTIRVLGITYDIGDDGNEDVSLVVGRPIDSLYDMLQSTQADVNALSRR